MLSARLQKLVGNWTKKPGASAQAIAQLQKSLGQTRLPQDYLDFLRHSNGGAGLLGEEGPWVRFTPIEEVQAHCEMSNAPLGMLLVGSCTLHSDLAFDIRGRKPRLVWLDSIDNALLHVLGTTLDQALAKMKDIGQRLRKESQASKTPDIGFVPTPPEVVRRMLTLARLQEGEVLYDLGCGDGRIVIRAAKKYGAHAVGFDVDPERVKEARSNVEKQKVEDRVTIRRANIFSVDLSAADVVTLYLLTRINEQLIPQLLRLKPGARIVSHDFSLRGYKPAQEITIKARDRRSRTLYLWEVPLQEEEPVL